MQFIFIFILIFSQAFASETEVVGDWMQSRNNDFRYVSYYNVEKVSRPMANFPWIQEDCHDDGDRFANWSKVISFDVSYSGAISFDLLGLGFEIGGERGETVEFAFERWVHATSGVKARHKLYEEFENLIGKTFVEYRYQDGTITRNKKTYPFKVEKVNYGIFVKREILEDCPAN